MANQILATVLTISGKAFARNAEGEMRELAVGDKLHEGETLVTSAGGQVELEMVDGSPLAIAEPEVAITRDLVAEQAANRGESAVEDASVAQVLQALEAGVDLSETLEATAAGGGGANDGSSFIRLARIIESTDEFTNAPGSEAAEAVLIEDQQDELIPVPLVSISDATVVEGGVATLTITLSEPSTLPVSVSFSTRENSAGGDDFVSDSGIVTFAPGQTSIDIQIQTSADGVDEDTEAFDVVLDDFVNADPDDDTGEVTVLPAAVDPVDPVEPDDPVDPVEPPAAAAAPAIAGFDGGLGDTDAFLESALADGTAPNSAALTRSGSFTVTAEAGFSYVKIEEITIVEGDGSSAGRFIPTVFEKDGFSMNISDAQFNPGSNSYTINYSLTLLDNSTHAPPEFVPADLSRVLNVPFRIEVQDNQQQAVETVRSVALADDGPIAEDDSASLTVTEATVNPTVQGNVVEGSASAGGSIAGRDNPGADGGAVTEVTGSEPDNDSNPLTAQGLYGELVIAADGSYSYNLSPEVQASLVGGQTLTDVFTYVLTDGDGDIDVNLDPDADGDTGRANLTITINKTADQVNRPPDALDDAYQTQEGTLINVPAQGVLANDGDPDGDSVSIAGNTNIVTTNGVTVTLNPDGSFSYTPPEGFTGTDTFEYTITDGVSTDTATVSVVVVPVNGPSIVEVRGLSNPFDEADLAQGSSPTPEALTREGDLTIRADAQLQSLTIEGQEILDSEGNLIVGITVANDEIGVIQVTFNSMTFDSQTSSYLLKYTVSLPSEFDHSSTSDTISAPFTLVAQDVNGKTSTAIRTGSLLDDNPDARDDANSVNGEVQTTAGNVIANGSSLDVTDTLGADGAALSSVSFGGSEKEISDGPTTTIDGVYGTLTIAVDGAYSYVLFDDENTQAAVEGLSAGAKLTEVFSYTLTDGDTDADQANLTITINGVNSPPEGNPDPVGQEEAYEVNEDSILTVDDPASGVLANDTDPDVNDVLTAINATDPAHGSVVLNTDGTFSYTPDADYNGPDSFTYQATDGVAITDPVTVSLNVSPVGDAVDDSVSTMENTAVTIDVFGGSTPTGAMADNFEDPAAAVLQLITTSGSSTTQVTTDANGTATLNSDGTVNYVPAAGFTGTDTFRYEVKSADGDGNETATVTVEVTPTDGPSIVEVRALSNAFDEADLPLGSSPTPSELQRTGSITIQADAKLKSLTVEGQELLDSAGNLVAQTVANDEVGVVEVAFSTLDFDDISNTYTLNYTVSLTGNFDHSSADLSANVPFDIVVQDVNNKTASTTKSGTLLDDAPDALADANSLDASDPSTAGNVVISGSALDVTDVQGADGAAVSNITFSGSTQAVSAGSDTTINGVYGALAISATGAYTYTLFDDVDTQATLEGLAADEKLTEVFNYQLSDGDTDVDQADLTITINGDNSAPTAQSQSATLSDVAGDDNGAGSNADGFDPQSDTGSMDFVPGSDLPVVFAASYDDGLGAATKSSAAGVTTFTANDGSWNVTINETTGVYAFNQTAAYDHTGLPGAVTGAISVTLTDSDGSVSPATLSLSIADDAPTATADAEAATENGPDVLGNVLSNDDLGADHGVVGTDARVTDISNVTTGAGTLDSSLAGDFGALTISADGSWSYAPNASVPAGSTDQFTYTATDADGDTVSNTLTVTFAGDSVPTAGTTNATVDDDGLFGGNPSSTSGDATDTQGPDETSFSGTLPASFGADAPGTIDFAGMDTLTGTLGTESVLYNWNSGANTLTATTTDGGRIGTAVFTVKVDNPATGAYTVTLLDNVQHDPLDGVAGDNTENDAAVALSYTVTDSDGSPATGTLNVLFDDDGPTAVDDNFDVMEDIPINIDVFDNDTAGADGVDLVAGLTVVSDTINGKLLYKDDGTFDYTPNEDFNGTDQFTYTITDADGDSDTATVDIVVAPVADPPTATIDVRYITFESSEFSPPVPEVIVGDDNGDDNIFDANGNAIPDEETQTFVFGVEHVGSLVNLVVTAQVTGTWNDDGGILGDDSFFEDNWSLTVDGRLFGPFQYNSDGEPSDANGNVNITEVITIEGVPVDSKGEVTLDFSASTTERLEIVTINTTATIDLPDTYIYEIDIAAGITAPNEILSVQISGTNSGSLTSKTGNTIVTENPAGSGIWDITFAEASTIADTLELRIIEGTNFQLSLVATSTDDGDSTSTTVQSLIYTDGAVVGSLVDGVVEGMSFSTSSGLEGITDSRGNFRYQEGDTITFSVGAVMLGSFHSDAVSDGIVFLQEIAGVGLNDLNNDYVENMAVFLQSMDNDGDAYNGIHISQGIHDAFSDDSFDLATISKADLQNVLLENGLTPVSEDDAMIHVRDMIIEHAGITEFDARESAGESLFATAGDDVFAFALSEHGEVAADVSISGFGASGTDALDLSDVLIGEEDEGADLSSYLNVSFDGTDTIVEVSSTGAFTGAANDSNHVDQTITLEGIDLVGSSGLDVVIQDMLSSGKLIVDQ